ncbi:MAG: PUA domain-containing protein [Candidatus Ranarchaeia archaeon]|jgi:PUA domain protein
MSSHRRIQLSSKRVKEFLNEAPSYIEGLVSKKPKIELLDLGSGNEMYTFSGEYIALKTKGIFIPPLTLLLKEKVILPKVTVDMGAVPYVTKGAMIMAPGICGVDPNAKVGDIVVIVDENHSKPLSIGKLLQSSAEILDLKQGRAVENLHHVSDVFWKVLTS